MFRFSYLHLMSSFVPGCRVTFSRHILRLLLVITVSQTVLIFDGLDCCEERLAGIWWNVPDWEASNDFLTISLGYGCFRKDHSCSHYVPRTLTTNASHGRGRYPPSPS